MFYILSVHPNVRIYHNIVSLSWWRRQGILIFVGLYVRSLGGSCAQTSAPQRVSHPDGSVRAPPASLCSLPYVHVPTFVSYPCVRTTSSFPCGNYVPNISPTHSHIANFLPYQIVNVPLTTSGGCKPLSGICPSTGRPSTMTTPPERRRPEAYSR